MSPVQVSPSPSPQQSSQPSVGTALQVTPYDPNQVASSRIVNVPMTTTNLASVGSIERGNAHIMPVAGTSPATLTYSAARKPMTTRRTSSANTPFDVLYYGGAIIGGALQHPLLVNTNYNNCLVTPSSSTTCWGKPGLTASDISASEYLRTLLQQYTNLSQANRYPRGDQGFLNISVLAPRPGVRNPVVGESDILLMVYNAAVQFGFGYGHIYHVFLPPNIDTCFDQRAACYSPDNFSSFAFCGYHSSVVVGGQKMIYTVEPYQDVRGCGFTGGVNTTNGDDLVDSTANTLTHELFETITDPDPGTGWESPAGYEIGDQCVGYFSTLNMNGSYYTVQSMWSNVFGLCTTG
ncbi:MAG: hypothetical protein M3N49_15740 [Candidatus Eremiobacteraeota bacterium]|nr:hypothetical protein [Candidatus Eremiobacteraeota bacterium]